MGFARSVKLSLRPSACAVAQFVTALGYKPEGGGLDSQLCNGNFLLT
jgi:hypothetical protein